MTATSKSFTTIADSAIDADSPLTEDLMEDFRDNDICLYEWLGDAYTPAKNHDHDGINSAAIAGASGGLYLSVAELMTRSGYIAGTYGNFVADAWLGSRIDSNVELCLGFNATTVGGHPAGARSLYDGDRLGDLAVASPHIFGLMKTGNGFEAVGARAFMLFLKAIASMIDVGHFTGTGSSNPRTGVGFEADALIINAEYSTIGAYPVFRSTGFGSANSKDSNGNVLTDAIISIDSDGFTLGTNTKVNGSGVEYFYIALKANTINGEKIEYVQYQGTGVTHTEDICSFNPDAALIIPLSSGQCPSLITRVHPSGVISDTVALDTGCWIDENGHHVDTGADVNNSGDYYDVIYFKSGRHVG